MVISPRESRFDDGGGGDGGGGNRGARARAKARGSKSGGRRCERAAARGSVRERTKVAGAGACSAPAWLASEKVVSGWGRKPNFDHLSTYLNNG